MGRSTNLGRMPAEVPALSGLGFLVHTILTRVDPLSVTEHLLFVSKPCTTGTCHGIRAKCNGKSGGLNDQSEADRTACSSKSSPVDTGLSDKSGCVYHDFSALKNAHSSSAASITCQKVATRAHYSSLSTLLGFSVHRFDCSSAT